MKGIGFREKEGKASTLFTVHDNKEEEEMRSRSAATLLILTALVIAGGIVPARAEWNPGDGHVMHYPQLPDPEGWDIHAEYKSSGFPWWWCGTERGLADDWLASSSVEVTDIHFWGSWENDIVGLTGDVAISIFADDNGSPGEMLWSNVFTTDDYHVVEYGSGDQGWFDPYTGYYDEHDHEKVYQYNIPFIDPNITTPFFQEEGNIYWLGLSMNFVDCKWGWKTSQDHFGADGHYLLNFDDPPPQWEWDELIDPITYESLDMAFVITPEPSTICLLALGALALRRKRKA